MYQDNGRRIKRPGLLIMRAQAIDFYEARAFGVMHLSDVIRPIYVARTPQQFDGQGRACQPRRASD